MCIFVARDHIFVPREPYTEGEVMATMRLYSVSRNDAERMLARKPQALRAKTLNDFDMLKSAAPSEDALCSARVARVRSRLRRT